MPGDGCPKCSKSTAQRPAVSTVSEALIESIAVPEQYKDSHWNEKIIREDYLGLAESPGFNSYLQKLSRVHEIFAGGDIPRQSLIVMAPRRFGKITWAYACMRQALDHGYTVSPLLDNTQYLRLNVLCSERPNSRYIKKLGYQIEDIDFADVVFITVDKANWACSFRTIDALIDKRSRLGKPTFVISRFSMVEMTRSDSFDNAATGIVDITRRNNIVRYPSIIECSSKPHR